MKYRIIAAAICISVTLGGCGSFAGRSGIDSGFAFIDSHEYTKALESFAKAEENGEDPCLIHRGKGIVYLNITEYEQAAQELLASLAADDGVVDDMDFDTNYYLAETYMKLGDFDRAKGIYDAILSLRDKDPNAYFLRGVCELAAGPDSQDAADADFTSAIRLNPKDYSMRIMIFKALSDNNLPDKANAILQYALDNDEDSMSNYEKGQIYFYLGNDTEAQDYLNKANGEGGHEKEPVVLLLGQSYERQQQYGAAIKVYKAYLTNNPGSARICNQLGMCQISMGNFEKAAGNNDEADAAYEGARLSLESGIALNDKSMNQALLFNQACLYEYWGDFATASKLMAEYLEIYPEDGTAQKEGIFLSTR